MLEGEPLEAVLRWFVGGMYRRSVDDRELLRARILLTMESGELGDRLRTDLLPMLDLVGRLARDADAVGRLRLAVHTLELTVVRYAVHSDAELLRITGAPSLRAAHAAAEAHLERLAGALFREALAG